MDETKNWPKAKEFESGEEAEKEPFEKIRKYIPIEIKFRQTFSRKIHRSFAFKNDERIDIWKVDYNPGRYLIDFKLFDDSYHLEGYHLNDLMRRLAKIILANYEKGIDHDY